MMKNYFENQRVNWDQFSPEDIIFKSNAITKKLLPEENVMSWTTKDSRHGKMAKKTGATPHTNSNWKNQSYIWYPRDSYKAVFVQLTKVKKEFVCANLDFVNYEPKKNSFGDVIAGLDALVYIGSFHDSYQYQKGANGHYGYVKTNGQSLPDSEGYRVAYGGQGDTNYMTHKEWTEIGDISEAVRNFLVERVVPFKRGDLKLQEDSVEEEFLIAV
jgi:hypothetical protein